MYDWKGIFDHMPARYTRENSPEDIAGHLELHERISIEPVQVRIKNTDKDRERLVTIAARDQPGLFCKLAGTFFLNDLDIQEARIYTWTNGTAIDIFRVRLSVDALLDGAFNEKLAAGVKAVLDGAITLGPALDHKMSAPAPAGERLHRSAPSVALDNNASRFFTVITISATDSMGLLYKITRALHRCNVNVCTARIGSFGYLVMDSFFVQELDGSKIQNPARVETITRALNGVLAVAAQ